MISGFNTDIEHDGVVYHIQTEDKGLKTPFVLSLVYNGGTILASKRSPYDDLIENGIKENELEERVQRQHKLICAAVRAGRIEDLKRMTMNRSAEKPAGLVAKKQEVVVREPAAIKRDGEAEKKSTGQESKVIPKAAPVPVEDVKEPQKEKSSPETEKTAPLDSLKVPVDAEPQAPIPDFIDVPSSDEEKIWDVPMIEDVQIIEEAPGDAVVIQEEEILLPPEAVKVIGDFDSFPPLIKNELKVKLLGKEKFQAGERKNVNVLVCRGVEEKAIAGAGIMIKVLGSDFRPQIFHAIADDNGVATVSVIIPEFRSGRAAVLVRAMIGNEEAEIRRSITHSN